MTEKRFKIDEGGNITDTEADRTLYVENKYTESNYFFKLLNQLLEENERLKSEYKVLHTQYQDLKKFVENNFDEYLTQEKLNRQIIKLSDENEQLKERIKELQKESYGNLDGLNYYQEQNGHLSSKISDLECENEQLKKQIEELKVDLKMAKIDGAIDRMAQRPIRW